MIIPQFAMNSRLASYDDVLQKYYPINECDPNWHRGANDDVE
jgi:hypothetical protein